MKRKWNIRSVLFFVLTGISFYGISQEGALFDAVKQNDFASLSQHLDEKVDLRLSEEHLTLQREDAIHRLSEWVSRNGVIRLSEVHRSDSGSRKSHFRVAKVKTKKGMFRLFVYVKTHGQGPLIKKIQIDPM